VASLGLLMTERVDLTGLRVFAEAHKGTRGGPSDTSAAPPAPARHLVDLTRPGTALDAPDPATLPLPAVADLPAVVVRTAGSVTRAVDVGSLSPFDVRGRAVLLHTGWDGPGPASHLTATAARWLVAQGAALVGTDTAEIDQVATDAAGGDPADVDGPDRPARAALVAAAIPVVVSLTGLDQLPPHGARFTAVPPPIAGTGPAPVRAFAAVP
jgi:kynurenine formamidase